MLCIPYYHTSLTLLFWWRTPGFHPVVPVHPAPSVTFYDKNVQLLRVSWMSLPSAALSFFPEGRARNFRAFLFCPGVFPS